MIFLASYDHDPQVVDSMLLARGYSAEEEEEGKGREPEQPGRLNIHLIGSSIVVADVTLPDVQVEAGQRGATQGRRGGSSQNASERGQGGEGGRGWEVLYTAVYGYTDLI
jgi:hypothetical protein